MKKVLVVDDEKKLRGLLVRILAKEDFTVVEADDCKSALKKLESEEVDVVLSDVKLPDGNGLDLTQQIKKKYPFIEIILLTAFGNIQDGVQAIKYGAFDYIIKGDENDKIIPLLYRAFEKKDFQKRIRELEKRVGEKYSFDSIIGKSKPIERAIELAKKVAQTDATVLLLGETGTGKEVFANAIHTSGERSNYSFVAINCSAFSRELFENELFGHKAGAFTGAMRDSKGLMEQADKGTLFLDEIGEMPLQLQPKFLRVLESGEFNKVGDNKTQKTDVRIIAATNRNLEKEVQEGRFREDLYYRLSVFQIILPSLRERIRDIRLLTEFFVKQFAHKLNKPDPKISTSYMQAMEMHPWKGNIRELKNAVERSMILIENGELTLDSLPIDMQSKNDSDNGSLSAFDMASAEKLHIQKVLNYTQGNKTETARLLNIGLTTLYRKMEEYKLE